jgi:hypothetical protein
LDFHGEIVPGGIFPRPDVHGEIVRRAFPPGVDFHGEIVPGGIFPRPDVHGEINCTGGHFPPAGFSAVHIIRFSTNREMAGLISPA